MTTARTSRFHRVDRDEARRIAAGASELPGIVGVPAFSSGVEVWLDKVGLGSSRADSDAMRAGRELERPILKMTGEKVGVRFSHNRQTWAHPRYPEVPLFATPDGFGPRRHSLAEVKLVGHRFADWADGPPDYVKVQAHGQLACIPRASRVIVGALIGSELRTWTIERDVELEDKLVADLVEWWYRYVVPEVAPPADSPASSWQLMRAAAELDGRQKRIATPDEQVLGAELLELARQSATIDERSDAIRRQLAELSSDSDIGGVGWAASWRERADVSWKSVAVDLGATEEQIAAHTRRSSSFVFARNAYKPKEGLA